LLNFSTLFFFEDLNGSIVDKASPLQQQAQWASVEARFIPLSLNKHVALTRWGSASVCMAYDLTEQVRNPTLPGKFDYEKR
jgi:hypothetical protein